MPIVNIPDRDLVIEFPDSMSEQEIGDHILMDVYDQPILSQGEEPGTLDKLKQGAQGFLGLGEDPGVGPVAPEDYEAFEGAGAPEDIKGEGPALGGPTGLSIEAGPEEVVGRIPFTPEEIEGLKDDIDGTPDLPQNTEAYLSYAPYLAVKALDGLTSPLHPALKVLGADTGELLDTATEYWREKIGDTAKIPNVGVGRSPEGKLQIEPREPVPFADLLGETSHIAGAVAGPVRAALGAGGLVAEKLSRHARPFFRSIARGMIGGALLGEGKKDETLQNMALFGVFEAAGYGIGRITGAIKSAQNTKAWMEAGPQERGLMVQDLAATLEKNPGMTQAQTLRKYNNPNWKAEAIKARELKGKDPIKAEAPAQTETQGRAEVARRVNEEKTPTGVYESLTKEIDKVVRTSLKKAGVEVPEEPKALEVPKVPVAPVDLFKGEKPKATSHKIGDSQKTPQEPTDELSADDLMKTMAGFLRQEVQFHTKKGGDKIRLSYQDKVYAVVERKASEKEMIKALADRTLSQLRAEGRELETNIEKMSLDEFTLAYEGGMIPEFEISGDEIGVVIQDQGAGFTVNIKELYKKVQKSYQKAPEAPKPKKPAQPPAPKPKKPATSPPEAKKTILKAERPAFGGTFKEKKAAFLKVIDQAIKKAPRETAVEPGVSVTRSQQDGSFKYGTIENPEQFVTLADVDGAKFRIFNRKAELEAFRKNYNKLKGAAKKPQKPKKAPKPKPTAHKKENWNFEVLTDIIKGPKGWVTDGSMVIKATMPKIPKRSDLVREPVEWSAIKESYLAPERLKELVPAEVKYYTSGTKKDPGYGISKAPIINLTGDKDIANLAVIKAGKKHYAYDQNKLNVILNRYPKATLKINPEIDSNFPLYAYDKGKHVAVLMPVDWARSPKTREKDIPHIKWAAKEGLAMPKGLQKPSSPVASGRPVPEGLRRSAMLDKMAKRLGLPIRVGKFRKNRGLLSAAGIYKPTPRVIRLANANDFEVAAHEIGHDLQHLMGITEKSLPREIVDMAYENAKKGDEAKEGFAEFVRFYVTDPKTAQAKAPTFFKEFENSLKDFPDIQEILAESRQFWQEWKAAPSVKKIGSYVVKGGPPKKRLSWNKLYTMLVDEIQPLKVLKKAAEAQRGTALSPSEDPHMLAWLLRGWARKAEQFLKYGTFQLDESGAVFTGKSLKEILQPVERKGLMDQLDIYLVAKRAVSDPRIIKGFGGQLTRGDFKQAVKELAPEFEAVAADLYKYNDELLSYLVNSGRISAEAANLMRDKNPFYAPLYRIVDTESPLTGMSKKKYGDLFSPVKRLKGSSRDIISPTENILYNTYAMINIAERNRVGRALLDITKIKGMGGLIERVPAPMKPIKMTKEDILNNISKALGIPQTDPEFIPFDEMFSSEEMPDVYLSFRPNYTPKANETILYKAGKPYIVEMDPELTTTVKALDNESLGMLVKILGFPAKMLRAGATLTPEFTARNPARDQLTAFVFSNYGFTPIVDLTKGIFHILKADKLYQQYNASGAAHAALVSLDRNYIKKNLQEILSGKRKVKNLIKNPIEALRALSELSEEGTRVGEFANAMKAEGKGLDALLTAGKEARDITLDFSGMGLKTKAMNHITAFWNAQVRGTDKMVRSFKNHPRRSFIKAFLGITVPSLLLWYAQKDDPYYQEIPPWRRILFWNIITHKEDGSLNHIWSIPKPFELGLIFGSAPEMALDWMYEKDPEAMKETMRSVVTGLLPSSVPTFSVPIVEWFANKSIFFNRPIVPRSKEDLEAVRQYGPYTSETVKAFAKAMGRLPGAKDIASPAKIENLIRAYTGGLGKHGLNQLDKLTRLIGRAVGEKYPIKPEMTLSDMPLIKGFAGRFPTANTRSIERFYREYIEMKKEYESKKDRAGVKGLGLSGRELLKRGIVRPKKLKEFESAAKTLSFLRRAALLIHKSRALSPKEKRVRLDKVYLAMVNMARATNRKPKIKGGKRK